MHRMCYLTTQPRPAHGTSRLQPERDGRCSMSTIITCDLSVFIDCDRPKASWRGGKPPNCNAPTRPIALRGLELCFIDPCVIGRDCLTRNLDDAHLLRSQRSVSFDSRRPLLGAGGQEREQHSDECGAHKRPNEPNSATQPVEDVDCNRARWPGSLRRMVRHRQHTQPIIARGTNLHHQNTQRANKLNRMPTTPATCAAAR